MQQNQHNEPSTLDERRWRRQLERDRLEVHSITPGLNIPGPGAVAAGASAAPPTAAPTNADGSSSFSLGSTSSAKKEAGAGQQAPKPRRFGGIKSQLAGAALSLSMATGGAAHSPQAQVDNKTQGSAAGKRGFANAGRATAPLNRATTLRKAQAARKQGAAQSPKNAAQKKRAKDFKRKFITPQLLSFFPRLPGEIASLVGIVTTIPATIAELNIYYWQSKKGHKLTVPFRMWEKVLLFNINAFTAIGIGLVLILLPVVVCIGMGPICLAVAVAVVVGG